MEPPAWIGTEEVRFAIPSPRSGKSVSCQPIDFGGLEGSVSAILILLFHRLRALQVGIVPFTQNTNKPFTFMFENSADPLWALRRTFTGQSHGMKSCTLGTNKLHMLFASLSLRTGPEFVLFRIGNWRFKLLNAPLATGYEKFCIGNLWGRGGLGRPKLCWENKRRYIVVTTDWFNWGWQHETVNFGLFWTQHFKTFLAFCCQ